MVNNKIQRLVYLFSLERIMYVGIYVRFIEVCYLEKNAVNSRFFML